MNVEKIREDFPILSRTINGGRLVYLDNAATTQKPVQVLDAMRDFYIRHGGNVGRGIHELSIEATEILQKSRDNVARFINAKPEEIVFTYNATSSLNLVAQSWGADNLTSRDEIATTIMEHHSSVIPWMVVAKKTGADIAKAGITDEGLLDYDDFEDKVSEKTKVVALTHTSNVLGTVNDAERIAKLAHDNGALMVLDGAQSVPHMKVDVKKIGCDFMAFSGHKMLAPFGIGVLYGKKEILDETSPLLVGGGTVTSVSKDEITFVEPPEKFEGGTPNVGGAMGLATAIDYLEKIGMENVEKHEEELTAYALEKMSQIEGIEIYGPMDAKNKGGIVSFNMKDMQAHDVGTILNEQGIAVRSGHHCCLPLMKYLNINGSARASFYIYTTKEEIDCLVGVLKKFSELA